MKNIILLLFLVINHFSFGQTHNSIIQLNYQPYNAANLRHLRLRSLFFNPIYFYNNKPYILPIELLYITSKKTQSATRYGMNIINFIDLKKSPDYKVADTTYSNSINANITIPKFKIGKEWRKHINQDVYLIAGLDGSVGAMGNRIDTFSYASYSKGDTLFTVGNGYSIPRKLFASSAEAIPFIGARTLWGPLSIGYQLSFPIHLFKGFETTTYIEKMQQINIGYSFNRKPKFKEPRKN